MKALVTCAMAVVIIVAWSAPVAAQQPGHQHDGGGPPAASAPAAPGARHDQRHSMPSMEMCRQMMGQPAMAGGMGPMTGGMGEGMMGAGMMGMMPMAGGDPKHHAEMMAMRGEMMKAMGEIMMKHAQRMQPGTSK